MRLPALNACNKSRMRWALPQEKKTNKTKQSTTFSIPVFRFPVKKVNILKLFALFLLTACLPCQKKTHFILSCVYVQAAACTCGCASAVVALLCGGCTDNPRTIRQRSCRENAAITICDQQVCQHSHFIRPFHTGLHSNEYYSALSYALQIPANDMLFFFFPPLWLSLSSRSPVPLALPTSDVTCSYFQTKKVWNLVLWSV